MDIINITSEYQKIVQERQSEIQSAEVVGVPNQRNHPRFKVETEDVWISSIPEFSLIDMSITGLAISANYPLKPGETIEISLGNLVKATAEVVECKLVQSPDEWTEAEFRINCRYKEDLSGMELLVRAIRNDA